MRTALSLVSFSCFFVFTGRHKVGLAPRGESNDPIRDAPSNFKLPIVFEPIREAGKHHPKGDRRKDAIGQDGPLISVEAEIMFGKSLIDRFGGHFSICEGDANPLTKEWVRPGRVTGEEDTRSGQLSPVDRATESDAL